MHRRVGGACNIQAAKTKKDIPPAERRAFKDIHTAKSWPVFSEDGCFFDKPKTVSVLQTANKSIYFVLVLDACLLHAASQTSDKTTGEGWCRGSLWGGQTLAKLELFSMLHPLGF